MTSRLRAVLANRHVQLLPLWIAITVVVQQPSRHQVTETVAGVPGDNVFVAWVLSWGAHALVDAPTRLLDANIFSPESGTLAFSDPMVPLAPIYGFLTWVAGGNRIAALNLLMLLLFVIGLICAHGLAHRILGRHDIAIAVAVAVCCNAYVLGQLNHPQLQTFGFVSLCYWLLFRALEHQRLRDGVFLGVMFSAMFLSAAYYGLIWATTAAVALGVMRLRKVLPPVGGLVRPFVGTAATSTVLLLPFVIALIHGQNAKATEPWYHHQNAFYVRHLLTTQRDNWSWGTALDRFGSRDLPGETAYFPGLLALAAWAIGIFLLARLLTSRLGPRPAWAEGVKVEELVALAAAAATAIILSSGHEPWFYKNPYRLLHAYVPGFDGVRVTARFMVVTYVTGGLLLGLTLLWATSRLRWTARWLPYVAAAIIIVEVGGPMWRAPAPPASDGTAYQLLAEREAGVVLELPIRSEIDGHDWGTTEPLRMLNSTIDWNDRVNGYSGGVPRGFDELALRLNQWPEQDAVSAADEHDVRYIILHGGGAEATKATMSAEQIQFALTDAQFRGWTFEQAGADWLITVVE